MRIKLKNDIRMFQPLEGSVISCAGFLPKGQEILVSNERPVTYRYGQKDTAFYLFLYGGLQHFYVLEKEILPSLPKKYIN